MIPTNRHLRAPMIENGYGYGYGYNYNYNYGYNYGYNGNYPPPPPYGNPFNNNPWGMPPVDSSYGIRRPHHHHHHHNNQYSNGYYGKSIFATARENGYYNY